MPRLLLSLSLVLAALAASCGSEPVVYDWQKPPDTYPLGAFTPSDNAEESRTSSDVAAFLAHRDEIKTACSI
jgi:hypothetical protein